jgi:hypothetical protein
MAASLTPVEHAAYELVKTVREEMTGEGFSQMAQAEADAVLLERVVEAAVYAVSDEKYIILEGGEPALDLGHTDDWGDPLMHVVSIGTRPRDKELA